MNRIHPTTLIGLVVLFLFAAGITAAAFFSFVIPEFRHQAFYAGLIASCIAEFVFFGYLCYVLGAKSSPDQPDPANRMRLMVVVVVWTVVVIVTSGMAAAPANADKFISDKIILIELVITFFFVAAVFFQHRQAVAVQMRDAAPQQERRRLECCAGGLDALLEQIRTLSRSQPKHVAALEGLATRIDTLKTQLKAVSPVVSREAGRPAEPADPAVIEERLRRLHDEVSRLHSTDDAQLGERLQTVRSAVDQALAALRQREDAMTF